MNQIKTKEGVEMFQIFIIFQIIFDIIFIFCFLYLLIKLNHKNKKEKSLNEGDISALIENINELITSFQNLSKKLIGDIESKTIALNKTSRIMDGKMQEIKNLLSQANILIGKSSSVKFSKSDNDCAKESYRKIKELKNSGLDNKTIAKKLEMPEGEVELILNLKEKKIDY